RFLTQLHSYCTPIALEFGIQSGDVRVQTNKNATKEKKPRSKATSFDSQPAAISDATFRFCSVEPGLLACGLQLCFGR
ncbi:hypothetical protein NXS19_003435, partial [Fusarium pseudograminearum]